MEIALISAVILIAFALMLGKTSAGVMVIELAKLLGTAFMLALVVVASMCSQRRPRVGRA